MPHNTNIILIRHAEKPDSGTELSIAGQQRAQAYSVYFANYLLNASRIRFDHLFAAADSHDSHRPRLTIEPLSKALGIKINDKHRDDDYQALADHILQNAKYDKCNLLICWHHEEILKLAASLGVDASKLPASSHWPQSPWPDGVFGWVLQLRYDDRGTLIPAQTTCVNAQLMYDDFGKNPPKSA